MGNDTGIDALYVVDDEYTDTASALLQKAARVQEIWDGYIAVSEEIVGAQGSLAGSRAKAYADFIALAKQRLGSRVSDAAAEGAADKRSYVAMIDEADDALY